jgi:hypothetical protein
VAVGNGSGPRGIDTTVRDRVMEQVPVVTDALDAAIANPTADNLDDLREATDKLMRALGRVLLEVERQRSAPQSKP